MDTSWIAPLIDVLTPILQVLVGALAIWLSRKLAKSLNVNITATQQKSLEDAVKQGVRLASAQARKKVIAGGSAMTGDEKKKVAVEHTKSTLAKAKTPVPPDEELDRVIEARVYKERPNEEKKS